MHAEAELTAGVRVGDILADKYRVERILGIGGMGVVVAAYHIHLDEHVAIKFLLPEAMQSAEVVARFAREARAAVKIKSEHVAHVIDVGTLASGSPYMVMEYLNGQDLSAKLQKQGPLNVEQTVEFVLQACEAIADAHGLGIVHRDLKPANLFCIRRSDGLESVKVLDFGISKVTSGFGAASDAHMTKTSAVFGSPLYMSPEQMLSSRDVDARSDIWAIGTIIYELLTGVSPFMGETLPEVYARISSQPPAPLASVRLDVPEALQVVIFKCLEKDRNRRYQNVAELAVALAPFGPRRAYQSVERISRIIREAGISTVQVSSLTSLEQGDPSVAGTNAAWGQTAPSTNKGSKKWLWIAAGSGLLVAAAGLGAVLARRPASATAEPSALTNAIAVIPPPNPLRSAAPRPTESVVVLAIASPSATSAATPSSEVKTANAKPPTTRISPNRPAARAGTQGPAPDKTDDDFLTRQY